MRIALIRGPSQGLRISPILTRWQIVVSRCARPVDALPSLRKRSLASIVAQIKCKCLKFLSEIRGALIPDGDTFLIILNVLGLPPADQLADQLVTLTYSRLSLRTAQDFEPTLARYPLTEMFFDQFRRSSDLQYLIG